MTHEVSSTLGTAHLCYILRQRVLYGVQSTAENDWSYFCLLAFSCLPYACSFTFTTRVDTQTGLRDVMNWEGFTAP